MNLIRRYFSQQLLLWAGVVVLAEGFPGGLAQAQEPAYPSRPITVIYPYAASAAFDPMYRAMWAGITERIGQPVIFESRGGASGAIGMAALARAKADGHTLVITNYAPVTILPAIQKDLAYDAAKDFAAITLIGRGESFVLAGPALQARSVGELLAQAKAAPGTITYAVIGSAQRLSLARIEASSGAKFLQVPYPGSGPAEAALLGGHVQLMSNSGDPKVLAKGGAIRLLATGNPQRSPRAPEVPAMAEFVPGFESRAWHGFLAPAGMARDRIDLLHRTIQSVMQAPKIREMMAANGLDPADEGPDRMAEIIREELRLHGELARKYNIIN